MEQITAKGLEKLVQKDGSFSSVPFLLRVHWAFWKLGGYVFSTNLRNVCTFAFSEDIESSSTSSSATEDNDGVVEPEEEVGQFHPSNTIMESLNQLEDEEVRVRKNKEELQEILAEEEDNKFMLEQTQKK